MDSRSIFVAKQITAASTIFFSQSTTEPEPSNLFVEQRTQLGKTLLLYLCQ
jgi:hypothetical protein